MTGKENVPGSSTLVSARRVRLPPSGCKVMRAWLQDSAGRVEAKMTTMLWAE